MKDKNYGRISVDIDIVKNSESYLNLFSGMVILRADIDPIKSCVDYVAYHKDFEPVQEGCLPPYYIAEFRDGEVHPKWRKA